jgi:hypothetical protein
MRYFENFQVGDTSVLGSLKVGKTSACGCPLASRHGAGDGELPARFALRDRVIIAICSLNQ